MRRTEHDLAKQPEARGRILRWQAGTAPSRQADALAVEEPLEIRVDTRPVSVTMRTPGHDDELAAGFLLSEGLLRSPAEIRRVEHHPRNATGNVVNVFLASGVALDFRQLTRHVFASSSCGLCGKATIDAVHRHFKPLKQTLRVAARTLLTLPDKLRAEQESFARTGGLHAAAVFDARGRLLVLREDVGRHNAVDKVLGFGLLRRRLPWDRHLLLVSGRASFEIVQKALAARIPVVCAVSAPSSLAVAFARASGQTLVGFLREQHLNVYAGAGRIRF
ncbi:MAG: formate dehydrogenase accessory sulfurtransferase FdhD [Verrucomicrobia bacterium]|nr:formate dehydrogenase accessory sulfurtransferase FdhD [Verrucomicrobiota bacterium]